jgi:hypothetical protein
MIFLLYFKYANFKINTYVIFYLIFKYSIKLLKEIRIK